MDFGPENPTTISQYSSLILGRFLLFPVGK